MEKKGFLIEWRGWYKHKARCIVLASSPEEAADLFGGKLTTGEIIDDYCHTVKVPVIRIEKDIFTEKEAATTTFPEGRLRFRKGDFTALILPDEDSADLLIKEYPLFEA